MATTYLTHGVSRMQVDKIAAAEITGLTAEKMLQKKKNFTENTCSALLTR